MDTFIIKSHCFAGGSGEISAANAAQIMGVSKRTAVNYCRGDRPDAARIQLLNAVAGKKIIPPDCPIWFDNGVLYTDNGHRFSVSELDNYGWHRDIDLQRIETLSARVKELESKLTTLATEPPPNVIPFPTHLTRSSK